MKNKDLKFLSYSTWGLLSKQLNSSDQEEFLLQLSVSKKKIIVRFRIAMPFFLFPIFLMFYFESRNWNTQSIPFIFGVSMIIFLKILRFNDRWERPIPLAWKLLLENRGIIIDDKAKYHQYIRSYIKKTNPNIEHYIYLEYPPKTLLEFAKETNRKTRYMQRRIFAMLMQDWLTFESPENLVGPDPNAHRRLKFLIPSVVVLDLMMLGNFMFLIIFWSDFSNPFYFAGAYVLISLGMVYASILAFRIDFNEKNQMTIWRIQEIFKLQGINYDDDGVFNSLINHIENNFPFLEL